MARFLYEVVATFRDEATANAWAAWMLHEHIADVLAAGAERGRIARLDEPAMTYLAQYEFASRSQYDAYLRDHSTRLRAEGLKRFAADRVSYSRRAGEILMSN